MWATGVGPLALGVLLLGIGLSAARRRLALRKRGIGVVARFCHGGGQKKYFRYTDLQGGEHEIVADYAAPALGGRSERIKVVYDPADPDRAVCTLATRTLVWRGAGIVLIGVPVLLFGLWPFGRWGAALLLRGVRLGRGGPEPPSSGWGPPVRVMPVTVRSAAVRRLRRLRPRACADPDEAERNGRDGRCRPFVLTAANAIGTLRPCAWGVPWPRACLPPHRGRMWPPHFASPTASRAELAVSTHPTAWVGGVPG